MNNNQGQNGGSNRNSGKKPPQGGNPIIIFLIISIVATVILNIAATSLFAPKTEEIKYSDFLNMVENHEVEEVEFLSDKIQIIKKSDDKNSTTDKLLKLWGMKDDTVKEVCYTGYISDQRLLELLDKNGVKYSSPIQYSNPILGFFISWIFPLLLIYGMFFLLFRSLSKKMGGGIMGVGQSKAKMYMQNKTGISFKDVAGQEEAKESLNEIVDFSSQPHQIHGNRCKAA